VVVVRKFEILWSKLNVLEACISGSYAQKHATELYFLPVSPYRWQHLKSL